MDVPRALVFRLLVKGNEALGTWLQCTSLSPYFLSVIYALDENLRNKLKKKKTVLFINGFCFVLILFAHANHCFPVMRLVIK